MIGDTPSDAELWYQIKLNDSRAFDLLFERYWSAVYTTSFIYLKDQSACTEITHDIFLNIWQKRHSLEIITFKNYLTTSARYHVYKVIRKEKNSPIRFVEHYYEAGSEAYEVNLGEEKLKNQEMHGILDKVLDTLPKRCKEIFVLSRFENISNHDIAERFGISKRTVENQITHALKKLRVSVKETLYFLLLFNI